MITTSLEKEVTTILVIGRESVGKSQLISSLVGRSAGEANFRGSTVQVAEYHWDDLVLCDTPGIFRSSDVETTRLALSRIKEEEQVLLVVQATQIDEDLREMLPLVVGRLGVVVVTFWDKVQPSKRALEALERLQSSSGVEFIPVNSRTLQADDRQRITTALRHPRQFQAATLTTRAGWRIEPPPGWLEHKFFGPVMSFLLLLFPLLATIWGANGIAEILNPHVNSLIEPCITFVDNHFSLFFRVILTRKEGDFGYGLLNMGPFLLVCALPTVILFSIILGVYKASGLVERMNIALHPWVRCLGLSGRDVVRVLMGFGCNVPAVISTRACSQCSRNSAISAISFGAACSYQLPATLAVLGVAAQSTNYTAAQLTILFLGYLLFTTVIYLWCTASSAAKNSLNLLMTPARPFMQWPTFSAILREAGDSIRQFFLQALPVFALICMVASLLSYLGVLAIGSRLLEPLMHLFRLPGEAALPVVLSCVRKDGIFLFVNDQGLSMPLSASQVLTAVYLAGVLLPCLVTMLTIARETGWRNATFLVMRQALFALGFSLILAWAGAWIL